MSKTAQNLTAQDFEPVVRTEKIKDHASAPAVGYWTQAFRRLRRDPAAVVCFVLVVLVTLGAIFIPFFCPFDYATQNVAFSNKPFFSVDPNNGMVHIFGTDYLGRDVFTRIWYGARVSLTVAIAAALIDCVIGVVYGGLSGYLGGRVDNVMMRFLEIVSGIPYMIVVLLLMAVLPRGVESLIIAYSLVGWTSLARLVRGQAYSLRQREFMVAARMMGAGTLRALSRHLLPNVLGVVVVHVTLDIPSIIFTEAFLSLLGLGVAPPYPSWGVMASEGIQYFQTQPLQLIVPSLFICITMLAFNLFGDRLQDALDPKQRRFAGFGRRARNKKSRRVV